jgi:quinol-cytochrome oxidoreductase complex cytochrome b subunit
MRRLILVLVVLLVLAFVALVAYAYLGPILTPGDFEPPRAEVVQPVDLGLD